MGAAGEVATAGGTGADCLNLSVNYDTRSAHYFAIIREFSSHRSSNFLSLGFVGT